MRIDNLFASDMVVDDNTIFTFVFDPIINPKSIGATIDLTVTT